jgi:hypothetical protein
MTSRNLLRAGTTGQTPKNFNKENMGYIIGLACFFAWLTHVFTCFAQGLWGFLVAGAIMFPIGILHGFYLWFK